MKLGRKNAHHAAHAPGDPCVVTRPETALHFNLKCHIAAQLRAEIERHTAAAGAPLRIAERCLVGRAAAYTERSSAGPSPHGVTAAEARAVPCAATRERVWLDGWDDVALERHVGDARAARVPDIVLYLAGRVVGAVEVFASHAVDEAKAEALAALGVPWVEVRADEALLVEGSAWTLGAPLPAHRVGPTQLWRCETHERERLEELETERRRAEAIERSRLTLSEIQAQWPEEVEERVRPSEHVRALRLVDLYFPSGKHFRNVYSVVERRSNDRPQSLSLERNREVLLKLPFDHGRRAELWNQLKACQAADTLAAEVAMRARTDTAMAWATGPLAERMYEEAGEWRWDRKYPLDWTHPRRFHFARSRGEWFSPPDLRDITWDRPAADALTVAHPAWTRRRELMAQGGPTLGGSETSRDLTTPTRRDPLRVEDFGDAVAQLHELSISAVYELRCAAGEPERVVVVPNGVIRPEDADRIDRTLRQPDVERLWISHPEQWCRSLIQLPWLPVFAAPGGGYDVSLDGSAVALPVAVTAFAAGSPEFAPTAVIVRKLALQLPSRKAR